MLGKDRDDARMTPKMKNYGSDSDDQDDQPRSRQGGSQSLSPILIEMHLQFRRPTKKNKSSALKTRMTPG